MNAMKWIIGTAAAAWLVLAMQPLAHGGFYWEMTEVREGMALPEGMPANLPPSVQAQLAQASERTVKHYVDEAGYRTEDGDDIVIVDYRALTITTIHPADKTFIRIDVEKFIENQPDMGKITRSMTDDFQITSTDEVKKIHGYTCRKYMVTFMMGSGEYWASEEVEAYPYLKRVGEKMHRAMSSSPLFAQMNISGVMSKIDGFPVLTVMDIMGARTTSTLKHIEPREIDAALFQVPPGYKETPMPGIQQP